MGTEYLPKVSIKDLILAVKNQDSLGSVVFLKQTHSLEQAVRLLKQHQLPCAPVMEGSSCLAMVGMLDIFGYVSGLCHGDLDDCAEEELKNIFLKRTVFEIVQDQKQKDEVRMLQMENSLHDAAALLSRLYQVVVMNPKQTKVLATLSQAELVSYYAEQLSSNSQLYDAVQAKLTDIGLHRSKLVSISLQDPVSKTIPLLSQQMFGGFPIVDEEGYLVGNLSASDFKACSIEEWRGCTVEQFLKKHSPKSLNPIFVREGATLASVINLLAEKHIHRVWVCNPDTPMPVGVVSLSDVLTFLSGQANFLGKDLKYFTPKEVQQHNCPDDCWVSLLGRVYNLTKLIEQYQGSSLIDPLCENAGEDISHWFDAKTRDVKTWIDPFTSKRVYYTPMGQFPHVPQTTMSDSKAPVNERVPKPWWKDNQYVIGLLSNKTRLIRIVNMLTKQDDEVEVCSEETLQQILDRYELYNSHASSYTWKRLGKVLDMAKTLQQNGIEDEDEEFERLGLKKHIPVIHIYFNDDLKFV